MSDSINQSELISRVALRLGISPEAVGPILEATLDEIYEALKHGECVSLRNFGTFYIRDGGGTRVFKFNPSQKWRKSFGWSSTYKGDL